MSVTDQDFFRPTFLFWLEKFQGVWQNDSAEIMVDRRDDGLLTCRNMGGVKQPLIDFSCSTWVKVEAIPGPLGFRPVILSKTMMYLWLGVDETHACEAAVNTGEGRNYLLKKIETAIGDTPSELRERKWLTWWTNHAEKYPEPMCEQDIEMHNALYQRFLSEEVD
jgi:hypothetical protein